jgi:hypothetical protein
MLRLIAIFALACGLAGCSSSPFSATPAAQVTGARPTPMGTPIPGIPASQYECVTDEGYGRWQPCGRAD